jgi:hypothetical protein
MKTRILLMALLAEGGCLAAQTREMGRSFIHQYAAGCLAVDDDVFAVVRMPGSLPFSRTAKAGFCGSSDWIPGAGGSYTLAAVKPRQGDAFALTVDHLRVGSYRSSSASLSYGLRLSEEWQAGIRIGLSHTGIEGYGSGIALPFALGAVYSMGERLRFSLHVDHGGRSLSDPVPADARKPLSVHFNVGQRLSREAGIALLVFKQEGMPVSFIPLLQYRPAGVFDIRAGMATGPASLYLCLGIIRPALRIDVAVRQNGALGWSSGLSLQWMAGEGRPR